MQQLELFHDKYVKTWCKVCGDNWGEDNYLIGKCCGRDLIYNYPMTSEEIYYETVTKPKLTAAILKRASELGW